MDNFYSPYCLFVASAAFCLFVAGLFTNELGWALTYLGASLFCLIAATDE